jgi:hypothetical protein
MTLFAFFTSGCGNLSNFFSHREVNKVHVISYGKEVKRYRGYFTRTELYRFPSGKRTLFLYHPKRKEIALLLHRKDGFYLHPFRADKTVAHRYAPKTRASVRKALRHFAKMGYRPLSDPKKEGFIVKTGLRRYKGHKTVMVEVEDYSVLKKHYIEALRHPKSSKLRKLPSIPASLIKQEIKRAYKNAKPEEKDAIADLARRLGIVLPGQKEHPTEKKPNAGTNNGKSFDYYLQNASEKELRAYLRRSKEEGTLDEVSYRTLEQRLHQLEYKNLLKYGTIDELIEAYRTHKDPRIKKRIMQLLEREQN